MADEPRLWGAENAKQEERFKDIIDDRVRNAPFYQLLGIEVRWLAPGEAHIGMRAGPRIYNTSGIAHGGAIAALADAASGVAMATLVPKGSRRIITVEQKVNFIAPVRETDLTGVGKVVHHDGELAVSTADIFDGEGNLAAKSIATHIVIPF